MRIKADFASETVPAGRQWRNICKDPKEKEWSTYNSVPGKMSFRTTGKIKTYSDKGKLRELWPTHRGEEHKKW